MKILQVNEIDLPGRRFNGYDLNLALKNKGFIARQVVFGKYSEDPDVLPLNIDFDFREKLLRYERALSLHNILLPYGRSLIKKDFFMDSDIVHYHLLHNYMVSIFDLPKVFKAKPAVWTWHDPWAITGHCIHPKECDGWRTNCSPCPHLQEQFSLKYDTANLLWKIKRSAYKRCDVDIVVSSKYMMDFALNSPLGQCFKKIHLIPFGINIEEYGLHSSREAKDHFNISVEDFVIAFRCETNDYKGCEYIYEALNNIPNRNNITILVVGWGKIPDRIKERFNTIELGWVHSNDELSYFYSACDVFLMPSIAESFGLMAIEAMASYRPVICFEGTALPSVTFAPTCGIAVTKANYEELAAAILRLMNNPKEALYRGNLGRQKVIENFRYEDYVQKHIDLYLEIWEKNKKRI